VRELREFRARHKELIAEGLAVAGVTRNDPEVNDRWAKRLGLPYPLLTDSEGDAGRAFGVIRRIGIASWKVEMFRRATFLVDMHGIVSAVWREVKIRGHAREVMDVARVLARPQG